MAKQVDDSAHLAPPVGSDYTDQRHSREGPAAFEKAPPEACAVRPFALKLVGLPVIEGELQGTLAHCQLIASKYRQTFHQCYEWATVEGEKV